MVLPRRRLAPGQVAVHRIELAVDGAERDRCAALLSADEHARAGRLRMAADRDRFVVARARLRCVLASYGAGPPQRIRFHYGRHGKPAVTSVDDLHFNVSHSGDVALIVVARGRAVGIDVERIRTDWSGYGIARRFFSSAELVDLATLAPDAFRQAFYRCWTRKEAYVKARGDGLSLPLDSFDVSIVAHGGSLLRATRPNAADSRRWRLVDLDVGAGYAAALAFRRGAEASALDDHALALDDGSSAIAACRDDRGATYWYAASSTSVSPERKQ